MVKAVSKPIVLKLQGGPGFGSPLWPVKGLWTTELLQRGMAVVLFDQRGTGRSSPITADWINSSSLRTRPHLAAWALGTLRADNIVRDAEVLRRLLLPADRGWTLLGQSFGGFCSLTYLSMYPDGLEAALTTGGLAGVDNGADDVYRLTYAELRRRTVRYFERWPQDLPRVRGIVDHLRRRPVAVQPLLRVGHPAPGDAPGTLPRPVGSILTGRVFRALGVHLGLAGGPERVHRLVTACFEGPSCLQAEAASEGPGGGQEAARPAFPAEGDRSEPPFLRAPAVATAILDTVGYATCPLYCVVHESIYQNGPGSASLWAAERLGRLLAGFREQAAADDLAAAADCHRTARATGVVPAEGCADQLPKCRDMPVDSLFLGEMVFPWLLEDLESLRGFRTSAQLLAERRDWPALYNVERLRTCGVPVSSVSFQTDLFVPIDLSRRTADLIPGLCLHVDDEDKQHNAIRSHPQWTIRLILSGLDRARVAHGLQPLRLAEPPAAAASAATPATAAESAAAAQPTEQSDRSHLDRSDAEGAAASGGGGSARERAAAAAAAGSGVWGDPPAE